MTPTYAVPVVALAMLLLLCGPDLVVSRGLAEDACAKCNRPVDAGGCKCDANCACLPGGQPTGGGGGGKCDKCNLPEANGGCKCDANCDCTNKGGAPPPPPAPAPFKEFLCTEPGGGPFQCANTKFQCRVGAILVGAGCMGQCHQLFGGCKWEHCNKGSPKDRCNEFLPDQCGGKCDAA